MARLVVMYGSKHQRTILLDVPKLVVGRGETAALVLRDETISRNHCEIQNEGTRHLLVDLDSTSGTFLNGNRLDRPIALRHGDKIELGKHTLVYERDAGEETVGVPAPGSGDEADSTGQGFWQQGLKESGFGRAAGEPAPVSGASGEAPWVGSSVVSAAETASRSGKVATVTAESYAGTMLASEEQMERIRETLVVQQGPHLAVVVKGERRLVPMKDDAITVGYYDGADFRLSGSRTFGRKQFRIFPSGTAWMLKVGSVWANVELQGKRVRTQSLLKGGEVIRAGGLKFRFSKGD